jgi:uncharacterized protein YyaL (SSP411 family)
MTRQHAAPRHTNRLISETSPYLLQHADNPVDWYPWGERPSLTAPTAAAEPWRDPVPGRADPN